jgi:hypothetical protein
MTHDGVGITVGIVAIMGIIGYSTLQDREGLQSIQPADLRPVVDVMGLAMVALAAFVILFMTGLVYVPIGYDRGKIKWLTWCGTGMHPMVVYRTDENGLQSLHPKDKDVEN